VYKNFFYFACLFLLIACSPQPRLYSQTAYIFGTKVDISIWGLPPTQAKTHIAKLLQDFDQMHHRLHAWQASELTRLNQAFTAGQTSSIDAQMKTWLCQAQHYERLSDYLFNPAAGQLIAAWGFHHDTFAPRLPSLDTIAQWKNAAPRLNALALTAMTVKSTNPAVSLDVGGIAKGWALDHAAAYFRQHQVKDVLINVGGNVLALGRKDQTAWTVGLQDPRAPEPMATLALNDGEAIGTSGDYQRYFTVAGQRYSHLLDPRSGWPAQGVMAATVIAPHTAQAGALSDVATKPLFIGGVSTAARYLERFAIKDALIITSDGTAYLTPSMQARLTWLRKPPHIHCLS
jgi:thiamine biosynthesis lipoprotein